jgi:hypothetical protein
MSGHHCSIAGVTTACPRRANTKDFVATINLRTAMAQCLDFICHFHFSGSDLLVSPAMLVWMPPPPSPRFSTRVFTFPFLLEYLLGSVGKIFAIICSCTIAVAANTRATFGCASISELPVDS